MSEPVHLVDVAPTILDVLGLRHPLENIQGRSLVPLAHGEPRPPRAVLSQWPGQDVYALRKDGYKLIENQRRKREEQRFELFHVDEDPGETRDLSSDPDHADARTELARAIELLREMGKGFRKSVRTGEKVIVSDEKDAELKDLGY